MDAPVCIDSCVRPYSKVRERVVTHCVNTLIILHADAANNTRISSLSPPPYSYTPFPIPSRVTESGRSEWPRTGGALYLSYLKYGVKTPYP